MRINQPNSGRERSFPAEQHLISATDTRGVITYCNDEFAEISGFTREELVGSPHNLVRHTDMPPAVFGHMWDYLKSGRSWMGIVKNRCKNGDHYWVSAYVTRLRLCMLVRLARSAPERFSRSLMVRRRCQRLCKKVLTKCVELRSLRLQPKGNSPGMYSSVPVTPMTAWMTLSLLVRRRVQSSR